MLHKSHNDFCLSHFPIRMLWLIGHRSLVERRSCARDLPHPKILAWRPLCARSYSILLNWTFMWCTRSFIFMILSLSVFLYPVVYLVNCTLFVMPSAQCVTMILNLCSTSLNFGILLQLTSEDKAYRLTNSLSVCRCTYRVAQKKVSLSLIHI